MYCCKEGVDVSGKSKWHLDNPDYGKQWRTDNKARCDAYRQQWKNKHREMRLIMAARDRAKKLGLPCTLTVEDVAIPKVCPVLGILLEIGAGKQKDSSPSIDRVLPELGYVPENIVVISMRANRIKNDGTAEEHAAIAEYMRNHSAQQ
jgi:hypothetical protein